MGKFDTHGGYFAPDNYIRVNEGGSHEENANGGVQMGVDPEGVPNLVEEDEVVYDDYVFSDNITTDEEMQEKHNLPRWAVGKLYSAVADKLVTEAEDRPNDPISNNGLEAMLGRLRDAQEEQKALKEQRDLEEELAQLSPEELDQLEQMLAEPQAMQGVHPGGDPVGPQGYMGAEDAMAAQAEQVPAEPMPVEGMPMMTNGGTLLRRFDIGGPLTDEEKQAIIDAGPIIGRRKRTMADEVKDAILAQALTGRASGIGNTDYPLVDEHPELDVAIMATHPGGVVSKALAPSMYRGVANGLANGEGAMALMYGLAPEAGFLEQLGFLGKAKYLRDFSKDYYKGVHWDRVRELKGNIESADNVIAGIKENIAKAKAANNRDLIRNLESDLQTQEFTRRRLFDNFESEFRVARESEPIVTTKTQSGKSKPASEPAPAPEPAPAQTPAGSTPAPQPSATEKPNRWRSAWQGAATGAAITGGMMLGDYLSNLETDLRTSNDYSDVGDDLDILFAPADTTKTQQSGNLIQLRNGGNLFYDGGPGRRHDSRIRVPLPELMPRPGFWFNSNSGYYNNDAWRWGYENPYSDDVDLFYGIPTYEEHPEEYIESPGAAVATGSGTANGAESSGSTAVISPSARTVPSPVAPNPALIGNGDEIDPRELMPSAANGWSFWMPLTETGGTTGGYSSYGFRAHSGTGGNYIPYRPEIDGAAFEAEEDYKNFLAHMLAVQDKEEAKQWMQYIQDEIARAGSKYKLKDFQNWYDLATDKRVGPVHQATKAAAQRLTQMRQMRANQLNIADGLRANALTGVADPNLIGPGQPESSFVPVLPLSLPSKGVLFDVNTTTGYRPENASLGLPEFKLDNPLQTTGVDAMDPLGRKKSKWETSVDGVEIGHPNPFASSADDQSGSGGNGDDDKSVRSPYLSTMPRYAGATMAGLLGLYNAFQQPDRYNIPHYNPVLPQGQLHLTDPVYNPLDQEQAVNAVLASNAGMNRRIVNSGMGPSVGATLLASDYNAGQNMGAARQSVWDANNQRRNAVIAAKNQNAGTLANFDYGQSRDRAQILNDAAMRNMQNDLIRQRLNYESEGQKYAAIQSNLDTIAQALSGIGQENRTINAINSNNALYHLLSPNGIGAYKSWLEEPKKDTTNAKCGGKIKRKK